MLHTTPLSAALAHATPSPLDECAADYALIRRAIALFSSEWRDQPSVEALADALSLTPTQLHNLFRRWCGLTPKAFLQALTLDHARALLKGQASLLDTAYELGLSGPGRLHDLFIQHEAMTPGDYKKGGEGLTLTYGYAPSPFGTAILVVTPHGLAGLGFCDAGGEDEALVDMRARWPRAAFLRDDAAVAPYALRVFDPARWAGETPLKVVLIGTDFEVRVWEALLTIPFGGATTYSTLADEIGKPKAARAVGAAVGKNPISFVVPCHRVLGANGSLTGYHWGLTRKQAMLGWEAGKRAG